MNQPLEPPDTTATEPTPVVLIVDDTPEYLTVLGEMLQAHHVVRVANSGERALELAARDPVPDLILLDVMMPGLSGFDVLTRLRRDERTRDIPVIFITGLDDAADELTGLRLGAADYIVKPLVAPVVLARVQTQIELKRARDKLTRLNEALRMRTATLERTVTDLETFSYSLSHDLRSPLSVISGFADLLQRVEAPRMSEEGQRRLGRIIETASRMDETIRDILACVRAERAEIRSVPVDLAALVRETLAEITPAYPATRVELGDLPEIHADPTMVRQVLANLLTNAFKFSSKTEQALVEVGLRQRPDAPAGELEVFVRDNGAGFDATRADKLFVLFNRMHSQSEFPGTGVGLAIVKRLVERHGGSIRAESTPGQGATFSFSFWPPGGGPGIAAG